MAPMMDWTDRWCRRFHRSMTRNALLYTEMIHANAVLHGDRQHLLGFDSREHPLALQLGGSSPAVLAEAARIAEAIGYDEINLNVGCPSERVQSGAFGACLMAEPETVAACVAAMKRAVTVPVTVKHRIGIDHQDCEASLHAFVRVVAEAGCDRFIVHARKAWLQGLSPRENREVPPLDYPRVYRLKECFPMREVVLNGGITDLDAALGHLERVDGVMLGRAAYQDPFLLAAVDPRIFMQPAPVRDRAQVVEACITLVEEMATVPVPVSRLTRHILGLFRGQPGARYWRRQLTEAAASPDSRKSTLRVLQHFARETCPLT